MGIAYTTVMNIAVNIFTTNGNMGFDQTLVKEKMLILDSCCGRHLVHNNIYYHWTSEH